MKTIRWGILSTAAIGREYVTPAIQQADGCEVVAIASRDADRAAAVAAGMGIPRSYGRYEALLEDDAVDAVYNPLPNDLHGPWTIRAADAGKHVLCEKPLAPTAAEAEEMIRACEAAGVKLAEAFMYRHHPSWEAAVRMVREGVIGELLAIQSWFSFFNDDPADIRNRPENGGGAMLDIGCYQVNLSRLLFGTEPESITAEVRRDPEMGIDILTSAILRFPGGGQSAFTCSIRSDADQRVHVMGSTGRIDFEIPFNVPADRQVRLSVTRGAEPPAPTTTEAHAFGPADQYRIQVERFARAISDDTPVAVPPADAVGNLRVIEAILAA